METIEDLKSALRFNIIMGRVRMSWTQTKLAEKAGTTPAAICRIEGGQRVPTLFMAIKIAKAFGISIKELCEDPANFDQDEFKKYIDSRFSQEEQTKIHCMREAFLLS